MKITRIEPSRQAIRAERTARAEWLAARNERRRVLINGFKHSNAIWRAS